MIITVKGLTYAKYASGGINSPVVYTGGKQLENLTVNVDVNFEYAEGSDYADGIRIAHKKKMTGASVGMELADLPEEVKADWFDWEADGDDYLITEQDPNSIGVGFYFWQETPVTEADAYCAYWVYKSKFSPDSISGSTSNDSISYQHHNVTGLAEGIKEEEGGKAIFVKVSENFDTEADAIAWLKAEAGIQTTSQGGGS
jgi:phi13 family phage major tail protein